MTRNQNYQRSNQIVKVDFKITPNTQAIASQLLDAMSASQRQTLGEQLLDELSDAAQIDIVKLKVSETRQYHKRSGGRIVFKQYGYYRPQSHYIYIQNLTPARGQILAPKTFLDTLLHEWLHHYDYKKLGLDSIHTSGFYMRLKSLKSKLGV